MYMAFIGVCSGSAGGDEVVQLFFGFSLRRDWFEAGLVCASFAAGAWMEQPAGMDRAGIWRWMG
jgi:hypothetical protein